jgi:hypothetical protein
MSYRLNKFLKELKSNHSNCEIYTNFESDNMSVPDWLVYEIAGDGIVLWDKGNTSKVVTIEHRCGYYHDNFTAKV